MSFMFAPTNALSSFRKSSNTSSAFIQRKCACGSKTASLTEECEECQQKKLQRHSLTVNEPNDRYEQEADRAANAIISGKGLPFNISPVSNSNVQREEPPKEKTDEEKYKEGAKKLGEAFLETPIGKQILERIKQDKLVKGATDFIGTLPGKIITGASAVGAVSALAAAHKELPAQIPEIPLDFLTPGLSVNITYNGPLDKPTDAAISFKFTEQAPKAAVGQKPPVSEADKFRAETARIAADQARFRASLKYPPGSPEDLQQKAEDEAIKNAAARYNSGPDVDAIIKKYPALARPNTPSGLQLTPPTFNPLGYLPPSLFGDQFKFNQPGETKKKEDEPTVQRKAVNNGSVEAAPPAVEKTIQSAGQPLDRATLNFMETRFGHDFSQVRIHADAEAAASAKSVNASAYTVGKDIVFGTGQYSPRTQEGRRLLAHELTHVVQQQVGVVSRRVQRASIPYRQVTWDDFKGAVPADPVWAAETSSGFVFPAWNAKVDITDTKVECEVKKQKSTKHTAKASIDPSVFDAVKATMDQDKSWVQSKYKKPEDYCKKDVVTNCEAEIKKQTDAAKSTCDQDLVPCQEAFDNGKTRYSIEVGGKSIEATSKDECSSKLIPECVQAVSKNIFYELKDAAKKSVVKVTTKAECSTDKFKEDCTKHYTNLSAQLLKHEQGHFDISNVMAGKAQADLKTKSASFTATATECGKVQANNEAIKQFKALDPSTKINERGQAWLDLKDKAHKDYDDKTDHGLKPTEQAAWEKDIAAGLPAYDLNKPAAPTTVAPVAPVTPNPGAVMADAPLPP